MADPNAPRPDRPREIGPILTDLKKNADASATVCERCGAEMYRMHAVWRCPACGFKTDCCGW